jgi:hypothetical protein
MLRRSLLSERRGLPRLPCSAVKLGGCSGASAILQAISADKNEEIVKKITLAILLLVSVLALAGADPNPADYTINVHVSSSRLVAEGRSNAYLQRLNVVIAGKKYELESGFPVNAMLEIGDYKAKLIRDEHHTKYDSLQVYESLFHDKKTRKFEVVGQTE